MTKYGRYTSVVYPRMDNKPATALIDFLTAMGYIGLE